MLSVSSKKESKREDESITHLEKKIYSSFGFSHGEMNLKLILE